MGTCNSQTFTKYDYIQGITSHNNKIHKKLSTVTLTDDELPNKTMVKQESGEMSSIKLDSQLGESDSSNIFNVSEIPTIKTTTCSPQGKAKSAELKIPVSPTFGSLAEQQLVKGKKLSKSKKGKVVVH